MVPAFWKAVLMWAFWHYLGSSVSGEVHKVKYFLLHGLFMPGNVLEIRDEPVTMGFANRGGTVNKVYVQFCSILF